MRMTAGSAFVAILRDGANGKEVFLIWRGDLEVWELPGGGMEGTESAEVTAVREVAEETSFQVTLTHHVAAYNSISASRSSYRLTFLFIGNVPPASRYRREYANNEGRWFPVDQLPEVYAMTALRIRDVLAFKGGKPMQATIRRK